MNQEKLYLELKDYSVSGEDFQLLYNEGLEMLETFPQPKTEKLSEYYKSEDYISHTDTKRNLLEKVYHIVRSISLKKKLRLIQRCLEFIILPQFKFQAQKRIGIR